MKRFNLKAIIFVLLMAVAFNGKAGKTVITNPDFPRKALLAPDCMINTMVNVAGVISGESAMNCILDESFDNFASMMGLAKVGLLSDPVIRVKDLENVYPAGTEAGFCVLNDAGKLLSLDLLKNVKIYFYLDGVLQEGVTVEQSNQELLSLGLIQVGQQDAELSLSAKSTKEFDEIGLYVEGVEVKALSDTRVKYAFVGKANRMELIEDNVPGIESNHKPHFGKEDPLTNNRLDDYLIIPSILIDIGAEVKLSWDKEFPKGTKVGFKFDDANILDLGLLSGIFIKVWGADGTSTVTEINGKLLGLSLIGKSTYDVSIRAPQAFNKAQLIISGLGIAVKARHIYYGYVEGAPNKRHYHDLNLSLNPVICPEETMYQLQPSDGTVTWELVSKPAEDKTVQVSPNGMVTNMTPGVIGDYVFKATALDGCSDTVTLTKGISAGVAPDCNKPIADEMDIANSIHGSSGSLISISDIKYKENIIDNDMSTYAEYIGGLTLANNMQIIGVKKRIADPMWSGGKNGKRVGFIVELNNGLLGLNALEFFRIRLYNNKTQSYVHDAVISKWNTVSAGLIGDNEAMKVRLSIEVPAGVEFDEITLWKSGLLDLELNAMRIYGVFMHNAADDCYTDDPLGCGSTVVSRKTMGASINYGHTGSTGVAQVGVLIKDLEHLVDDDIETYTYVDGIQVGVGLNIAVNLGKTLDKGQQIGIVMDENTYLANLDVFDSWSFKTYYKGRETGDQKKGWNVLGLDAIGFGDKIYLFLNPTRKFDEVRLETGDLVKALSGLKIYGLFVRQDADADGIPDCEDESTCKPPVVPGDFDFILSAKNICQDDELTVTIVGDANTIYNLSCNFQGINNVDVLTDENGQGVWVGTMPKVGLDIPLTVTSQDGAKSITKTFTVHPLQSKWNGSVDTNWNNWENWSDGSPLTCTNVIIPAGCAIYPILTVNAENLCNNIHFEMGGEVLNTHLLTYSKASVDMAIEGDRYYMLSAPLHSMVTGDMFIPVGGNPPVFTDADAQNSPQNRFNPRIYQRLWEANAKGRTLSSNTIDVVPNETRWTPPFNYLAQNYSLGMGFSLKAVRGTATGKLTFRFPKTHASYEYVTDMDKPTGIVQPIERNMIGRFIYENTNGGIRLPFSVTLSNNISGNTFLVGNPFMSHIDIQKFMVANNLTSVKVYDGNSANSLIMADGELVSNGADFTHIAPMQSVFVTVANVTKSLKITFTEEMLTSSPGMLLKSSKRNSATSQDLCLMATVGENMAKALIRVSADASNDYIPGEDAELLLDNEVRPNIALFSIADSKSLDIQLLDNAEKIPLGFYLQNPDVVNLIVRKSNLGEWKDWYLVDIQNGKNYSLDSEETVISLGRLTTNVGRFFLVKGNSLENNAFNDYDDWCYCFRESENCIVVRSKNNVMNRCEVYSENGMLVDLASKESKEFRLNPTSGINILKVYMEGREPKVLKISCY